MGTKGYYAFKYKNIYFVFYVSHDAYLRALGDEIVRDLPMLDISEIKQALEFIPFSYELTEGEVYYPGLSVAVYSYDSFSYFTTEKLPSAWYVYIVDLDDMAFIVMADDNTYEFKLKISDLPSDLSQLNEY